MSHSAISPSGANRWLNCRHPMAISEDRTESVYAKEGSMAHNVAEVILSNEGCLSTGIPDDMIFHVKRYVDYISNIESDKSFVEKTLDIDIIDGWGTADYLSIKGNNLDIVDFKYGQGKRVKCSDPQLKLYAYGAIKWMENITDIDSVTMHIVQPRINTDGVFESTTLPSKEILTWAEKVVVPAVKELKSGEGKYNSGEWCWFCPSKHLCPNQAIRYFK